MEQPSTQELADRLLLAALPDVVFDGWTPALLSSSAARAGLPQAAADALFPDGVAGALAHFADWADREMLDRLSGVDGAALRVRDRIRLAVLTRLEVLRPWREAERLALRYWALPAHGARGTRVLWRTADRIWDWAGDTARDYNRYTKRALLCGVLGATMLAWLAEDGDAPPESVAPFLDRRIENVMQCGRILGKLKGAGGRGGAPSSA